MIVNSPRWLWCHRPIQRRSFRYEPVTYTCLSRRELFSAVGTTGGVCFYLRNRTLWLLLPIILPESYFVYVHIVMYCLKPRICKTVRVNLILFVAYYYLLKYNINNLLLLPHTLVEYWPYNRGVLGSNLSIVELIPFW